MGEAKRKRDRMTPVEQAAADLTHKLAREGKLIEGGFAAYLMVRKVAPEDRGAWILREAYMAGAEHLWSSIMGILDPGEEPTEADMYRMDLIGAEIEAWADKQRAAYAAAMPTKGSA